MNRRIKIEHNTDFHHHDGWRCATEAMSSRLHHPFGVQFYDWLDWPLKFDPVWDHEWAGFLHNVIDYPSEYQHKYTSRNGVRRLYSLRQLTQNAAFLANLQSCQGLFTLSQHTADFLSSELHVEAQACLHPYLDKGIKFNIEAFIEHPTIIATGQWLRRLHSIYQLVSDCRKILVKIDNGNYNEDYKQARSYVSPQEADTVIELSFLPRPEYNELVTKSLVFLDLYDAAACNSILECVMSDTPILVNKLPATEEYLGVDYPLFFSTLHEAGSKSSDLTLIRQAHEYLCQKDKSIFTVTHFLQTMTQSDVYQSLPVSEIRFL